MDHVITHFLLVLMSRTHCFDRLVLSASFASHLPTFSSWFNTKLMKEGDILLPVNMSTSAHTTLTNWGCLYVTGGKSPQTSFKNHWILWVVEWRETINLAMHRLWNIVNKFGILVYSALNSTHLFVSVHWSCQSHPLRLTSWWTYIKPQRGGVNHMALFFTF